MDIRTLDFPTPGSEFDGRITVASGWITDEADDVRIGVLLLDEHSPGEHYEVAEYRCVGDRWEQKWGQVHANIVPAARQFHGEFGFWGEGE